MLARFVDGTWDGKLHDTKGARLYIVPKPLSAIGSAEDFCWIDVAAVHDPSLRPPIKVEDQVYHRRVVRDVDGQLVEVLYELEAAR